MGGRSLGAGPVAVSPRPCAAGRGAPSTMSSPDQERAETRAGHPPAVKAGGMRIVQKHPHTPDAKEEKDKDDQEWESSSRSGNSMDLEGDYAIHCSCLLVPFPIHPLAKNTEPQM
uniref:Death-associated protein 1 n=1 Tax=Chelydra serpentina TaxID=8475 RepID=A0A8C3SVA6_CHESE